MFPNIQTPAATSIIFPSLWTVEQEFGHYHVETLITVLKIVMDNNIVQFGDLCQKKVSATAMGKYHAPMWANIFKGLHELEFLPCWTHFVLFYVRFIDNVYDIWISRANSTLMKTIQARRPSRLTSTMTMALNRNSQTGPYPLPVWI